MTVDEYRKGGEKRVGLILSGGGARAAYQVGVLTAIADVLPPNYRNPFDIICGTSAGAINATALATHAIHYRTGVRGLQRIWRNLSADQVYRTDMPSLLRAVLDIVMSTARGGEVKHAVSLLDNTPLRRLLGMVINFRRIQRSIDMGDLYALSITASSYSSGESISFFQGRDELEPWHRSRRIGRRAVLSLDHLLASTAIPGVFPSIKLDGQYYGDGAIRQLAPLSPALHLGADKVLIIGVSDASRHRPPVADLGYPSLAKMMGHIWSASFIDSFESDVERLERINRTIALIPEEVRQREGLVLRPREVLKINPSEAIDEIASRHAEDLPRNVRFFLRGSGATKRSGAGLLSYLLFESRFCGELISLGYRDAMSREAEIRTFLNTQAWERAQASQTAEQ